MSSGFENTMHFLEGRFCQLDKTSFAPLNLFGKACFRLKETFFSEVQVNLTHSCSSGPFINVGLSMTQLCNLKQPCTSVTIVLTTNVINPLATFPLFGLEKEKSFLTDFSQYHFVCNYILTCNTSRCASFK